MRNPRIFTPQVLASDVTLTLDEQASHHLSRVLRFQTGYTLTLFNGDGSEYPATITAVDKRSVTVAIAGKVATDRESPFAIHLGIAISKGDRMDLVVQKAVELGVASITPLLSERVEVRLHGERAEKKIQHWQGIVIAACEQCARNRVPQLNPIAALHDWIADVQAERKFVLHHRSAIQLGTVATAPTSAALLIGPEGGLSDSEISAAERADFSPLRLGPRVLRTETAPLAAITVLQYAFGDLNR
ncbi:MAG: 16S rRNA (uracil(1498)-N(3))-methyltransferase [Spongiibacteraceae bacterium]